MKTEIKMAITFLILLVFAILAIASGESKRNSHSSSQSRNQSEPQSQSNKVFEGGDISIDFSSGSVNTQGIVDYNSSNSNIEDRYDSGYHLYMYRGSSFSFVVNIPDNVSSARLKIRHLTSMSGSEAGYSPISLYVNGKKAANWSSLNGSYQDDYFDIYRYLNSGNNRIELSYASDSGSTGYWINSIQLIF